VNWRVTFIVSVDIGCRAARNASDWAELNMGAPVDSLNTINSREIDQIGERGSIMFHIVIILSSYPR
jgi:hypothetical protein